MLPRIWRAHAYAVRDPECQTAGRRDADCASKARTSAECRARRHPHVFFMLRHRGAYAAPLAAATNANITLSTSAVPSTDAAVAPHERNAALKSEGPAMRFVEREPHRLRHEPQRAVKRSLVLTWQARSVYSMRSICANCEGGGGAVGKIVGAGHRRDARGEKGGAGSGPAGQSHRCRSRCTC